MGILDVITDYTFLIVAIGACILGITSGILSSFSYLKKQSLLGDGISHSALAGVVAAFLITGSMTTEVLLVGAFISGTIASVLIIAISTYSKIKFDTSLAIVMSVFFALGIVLLSFSQKLVTANQAGLERFIFGQASSLLLSDIIVMACVLIVILFFTILLWKEFKAHTFDPLWCECIGFGKYKLTIILSSMTVVGIIVGIQTVGVILMSAMLITPAVCARCYARSLLSLVILSCIFGLFSGFIGTLICTVIVDIPTGPSIVLFISTIAIISLLFAPKRGIISKIICRNKLKNQMKGAIK